MSAVPLLSAWLCVNEVSPGVGCDTIHDEPRCPACGSEAQPFKIARVVQPMLPEREAARVKAAQSIPPVMETA
jgi:hypothetical protein